MTSERKIVANRLNGRRGNGPRTEKGKHKSRGNALRHGLTTINHRHPLYADRIRKMAQDICGDETNPLMFEQALIIAECEVLLQCIDSESIQIVERLRYSVAAPIAAGRNVVKPILARHEHNTNDLARLQALYAAWNKDRSTGGLGGLRPPDDKSWCFTFDNERDEHDAFCVAIPDLLRFARYERRARSRQIRAINTLVAIRALGRNANSVLNSILGQDRQKPRR
jgi:hypothetical protein